MTIQQLRIARPVTDLAESSAMYCSGLGLMPIGEFTDHEGFSGVMLGDETLSWHLEFTHCHHHPVKPASTAEDLLVLYLPSEADWQQRCLSLTRAGFTRVTSFNPYWAENGATFQDKDGYRTVLQHGTWRL
ncbi:MULTISPECIES: VOC family protein [Pantoea]|nr:MULTISPECIES: VOC family protein [Pantoea]AER32715.1 glyoxylase family protein YycE [Pantoea ananatis PA13]ERM14002.1 glyoxalase [Pantoea ananatis BRT175]MDF7789077.1 glyoxalase [Pantoea ananatis]MDI3364034.1 glyoxalase [Pantoea sp. V108_6]MDN4126308.1 glyoxalase [Pantoea ananatis]